MSNVTVQEALKAAIEVLQRASDAGYSVESDDAIGLCKTALSATLAQHINNDVLIFTKDSLQKHDNATIEKCAKVCDGYTHGVWFADKIRALKGK